jgi:hypothetical protein
LQNAEKDSVMSSTETITLQKSDLGEVKADFHLHGEESSREKK